MATAVTGEVSSDDHTAAQARGYTQCAGVTSAGERCRARALRGAQFCHWHTDPEPDPPGAGDQALPHADLRRRPSKPQRRRTR